MTTNHKYTFLVFCETVDQFKNWCQKKQPISYNRLNAKGKDWEAFRAIDKHIHKSTTIDEVVLLIGYDAELLNSMKDDLLFSMAKANAA